MGITDLEKWMNEENLQYHMRLRVFRTDRNFGPGVAGLMERVEKYGSLSAACKEMGMAYSKAWKIIRAAEADLGFSLMEGSSGGENGGSTVLTEMGTEFLRRYRAFEVESEKEVSRLFMRYFKGRG